MVGFIPVSLLPYVTEKLRAIFNEALRMSEPARTERMYEVYKEAKEEHPEFADFILQYYLQGARRVEEEKKGGGLIGGILGENWQLLVGAVLVIIVLSFFRK